MLIPLFLAIAYGVFKRKVPTRFPERSQESLVISSVDQSGLLLSFTSFSTCPQFR
ncbi:hypothetical protein H6H03_24165 [Nostoc paludosum FACHB-159]|uniref:Uncharacterized protein n=1 Tax=Nostoc paludosum FACHB-159 TaxID=2692908 RepID=A0ABR8KFG2_9NOSO|nr:hypothetical protein [Nostoc sp. FACHB-857]MBD2736943.1 hypothetical protein [Nostoc paludosum FACHB-159]